MGTTRYEVRLIYYPACCKWQVIEVIKVKGSRDVRNTLLIGDADTPFEAFKTANAEINKFQRK